MRKILRGAAGALVVHKQNCAQEGDACAMKFRSSNSTLASTWRLRAPPEAVVEQKWHFSINDVVPEKLRPEVLCYCYSCMASTNILQCTRHYGALALFQLKPMSQSCALHIL